MGIAFPMPLKIAILTTDNRDHNRDYSLPFPVFGTAPEALLQGFALLPETEVHIVACVHRSVASPKKIADNIFYHSVLVPRIGWMRTLYQGCVRASRKKLREIQPDIVHGQGTELDCGLNAIFSGFPNVLTIHGNMRSVARVNQARPFSFLWLAARLENFALPRSNGVVCITHYTKKAVAHRAQRTWVLPNAVDAGFFEIHAKPNENQPPIGLCIGTICHHKNQNAFIRALDTLAAEKKFKIIFLGQPGDKAYSREFFELIKVRPWCEYAGFAGRETLKEFFLSATFLVLPTLEDNCPMVVLEAMAAGVPVIASDIGGIPDLIQPEITGLLARPELMESFREGVRRLLVERPLAANLAAAARQEARRRFLPEVIARGHLKIYREILQRNQI